MDEHLYRHVVVLLLSYVVMFVFVLSIELLSLGAVLGAVVLGSVVGLGILSVFD